jgi:type I restriction enzyme M protein
MPAKKKTAEPFEKQLFKAADKLRKNIDAAEYKHVVLGLIFLKYISDAFEEYREKLKAGETDFGDGEYIDLEDRDFYAGAGVFWVPQEARWETIHAVSKQPTIGKTLDEAMDAIERENSSLKGVLPKIYAKENLDQQTLGGLIDLIADTAIGDAAAKSKDLLGRVYEYFLGEFANAEGKKGGQFYTPKSIVRLMVEMIEPYKGRVYDPACGSGGMFVMSEKFVEEHGGGLDDISLYGQESNQTTWKLSRMNLAIRGIDGSGIKWTAEGSFLKDEHRDLKADYIIANPPFNQDEWGVELLQGDARWQYGTPPKGNANYGWIQHMLYHTAPNGICSLVLANGSLSSNQSGEGEIREALVRANLVDCIVALPKQLFYNTGIPACLWFLRRGRTNTETLFIDASSMGYMEDRTHRAFADEDITKIRDCYRSWRILNGEVRMANSELEAYADEKGFSKSATLAAIEKHNFILTPGRYVGIPDEEDDGIPYAEKIADLTHKLSAQIQKEEALNQEIQSQLSKVGINLEF